jgi:hypothetical protein
VLRIFEKAFVSFYEIKRHGNTRQVSQGMSQYWSRSCCACHARKQASAS